MDTQQKFKLYCSNITKTLDPDYSVDDKTQPLILEGVNVGLDDVIGTVLEVLDSDQRTLRIKFSILPLFRRHIEECIDNGVKLGLSIGGTIIDYDNGDDGLKIKNMMLHEISLTPLPANWNTMGTVVRGEKSIDVIEAKCLNGVCKQFLNNINKNIEPTQDMEMEKRYYTKDEEAQFMSEDRVVELINEALNNFANNLTEERVNEIIDEKLADFVKQAKALEKEEKEEEKRKRLERIRIARARKAAEKEKEEEEKEEEEEEPEEEEEEKKEKETKKESIADLTPQEFGSLIAEAVQITQKAQEPEVDIAQEIKSLKREFHKEMKKAMDTTKHDIEKTLFEDLRKNTKPESKVDQAQIKKFLKTKSEREAENKNTLNVKEIAKTLSGQ